MSNFESPKHKYLTKVHTPFSAIYANESARLAASSFEGDPFSASDLYKSVWQRSTSEIYILDSASPVEWAQIAAVSALADVETILTANGSANYFIKVKDTVDGLEYISGSDVLIDIGGATEDHVHGELNQFGQMSSASGASNLVLITGSSGSITTLASGANGEFLAYDGTWKTPAGGSGGGASLFTQLNDTPSSLAGADGKFVSVNGGTSSLEFVDADFVPKLASIINVSASRNLAVSDNATVILATSATTLNCPDGLSEGFQCVVARMSGSATITATTTLQYLSGGAQTAASGVTVDTQCTLLHRGSNVWLVLGEVTPV
jgi:hypothetical protein